MKADDIKWERSDPPVSVEQIEAVEERLGVRFPDDYRNLIPICHGGHPVPVDYLPAVGTGPDKMLSFYPGDSYHVVETVEGLAIDNQLPDRVIPFAEDGGGDMMCFDFREDEKNPKIMYWSHEVGGPEAFSFLANSFTEFLEMLIEDPYVEMFAPSSTE